MASEALWFWWRSTFRGCGFRDKYWLEKWSSSFSGIYGSQNNSSSLWWCFMDMIKVSNWIMQPWWDWLNDGFSGKVRYPMFPIACSIDEFRRWFPALFDLVSVLGRSVILVIHYAAVSSVLALMTRYRPLQLLVIILMHLNLWYVCGQAYYLVVPSFMLYLLFILFMHK